MSHKRHVEDERRLEKLYNDVFRHRRWIICGVYHRGDDDRYIRVYRGRRSKVFKKICNRKIRHYKDLGSYGAYRKASEFWWEIW